MTWREKPTSLSFVLFNLKMYTNSGRSVRLYFLASKCKQTDGVLYACTFEPQNVHTQWAFCTLVPFNLKMYTHSGRSVSLPEFNVLRILGSGEYKQQ